MGRETSRLSEEAAVEFNSTIRTTVEEAARRLARELDRSIETFVKQADRLLAERLAEFNDTAGGSSSGATRERWPRSNGAWPSWSPRCATGHVR